MFRMPKPNRVYCRGPLGIVHSQLCGISQWADWAKPGVVHRTL
jgi:hypothetical protein